MDDEDDKISFISPDAEAASKKINIRWKKEDRKSRRLLWVVKAVLSITAITILYSAYFLTVVLPERQVPETCPDRQKLVSFRNTFTEKRLVAFGSDENQPPTRCEWVSKVELRELQRTYRTSIFDQE